MKILDLKFKAFGPFLKEQHIDFTELNDKGMFLINGPTGTGKTSLFDAVVFALYGKGSGKDRDDGKSLRSDFAKDEDITYVDLKFEANGQVYRIYRQPAYMRKAKKGGGLTSEAPKAELYMPDGSIISKPKDVDDKIVNEILFINRDQFKSVALLAQGEFTELITATSKDRAAILEHIFQKEIYDEFQRKITELSKKAEDEKNSVISSVNTLINKVEGGEEIIGFAESLADPANIPTFIDNVKELIKKLKEDIKEKHKMTESAQKEFNAFAAKLSALQTDNKQVQNYLNALEKLEDLSKKEKMMELSKKLMEGQIEINSLKPLFNQLDSLNKAIKTRNDEIEQAKKELNTIKDIKKWLLDKKDTYENDKVSFIELNKIISSLSDIAKDKNNLIEEKTSVVNLESQYDKQFDAYKKQEKEFIDLKDRFFASSSYNLAQLLEEGKPCPVCGSIHHPDVAHASNPVSENEYKEAEKEYNSATSKLNQQKNLLDTKKAAFKTKENALIETLKKNGFADADEEYIYSNKLNEELNKLNKELKDIESFIEDYEDKEKQVSKDESKYSQAIESAEKSICGTEETIKTVENDIDEKLSSNVHIKTREEYIKRTSGEGSKLVVNIEQIKKDLAMHEKEKTSAQAIVDSTPKELIEKGNVDEASLIEEVNLKKSVYESLNKDENSLNNRIDNLTKDVNSIQEAYKKCENTILKYSSLNELARTANGANRMKLGFKMYILADYFDKIIIQANHRLSKITNGRYKLVRRDSLGKGNAQQGLDLDVYDIETGKERPASSLSGGEKFVSALSMALGLSDIIETNHALIQVESIFIDEGFGSLDENYLDMAMKALETLKDDNKTVAIISHVEKLKEYIPDGLEVQKAEVGSRVVFKPNI